MLDALEDLPALSQPALWAAFLVFLRVGAVMALLPAFGEQSVPLRVRLGLTVAFTMIVTPSVTPLLPPLSALAAMPLILTTEILAGLLLGILLRLFVMGLSIAGSMAAQATSLSQIFGGSAGSEPQPAIAHVLVVAGLALATMMGLHVRVAEMMVASYAFLPPGLAISAADAAQLGIARVAHIFAFAFTLAAPFLIAATLYNVTLGVINRAMPQLMVAFVGAPVITAGGLVLLALAAPMMLQLWVEALGNFLANPLGAP